MQLEAHNFLSGTGFIPPAQLKLNLAVCNTGLLRMHGTLYVQIKQRAPSRFGMCLISRKKFAGIVTITVLRWKRCNGGDTMVAIFCSVSIRKQSLMHIQKQICEFITLCKTDFFLILQSCRVVGTQWVLRLPEVCI